MENSTTGPLLTPGSIVAGRYEIQTVLGSGGMGQVYRAVDNELSGELVALKLLHHTISQERSIFDRFKNEVSVARGLAHPNIVRTYDLGKAPEGYYYISMEYVEGQSLKEKLEAAVTLPVSDAAFVLYQLLQAVAYAHSRGVIHRDLKPANVMICKSGEVKLADFGTARLLKSQAELTPTGQVIGTPYYMAPEQVRGEEVDAGCDIYALGIIGFELVTGKRPFDGENYVATAYKHLTEAVPKIAGTDLRIPQWYEDIIYKATAKSKTDRFSSAKEFASALKRYVPGEQEYLGDNTVAQTIQDKRFTTTDGSTTSRSNSLFNVAAIASIILALFLAVITGKVFFAGKQRSDENSGGQSEPALSPVPTAVAQLTLPGPAGQQNEQMAKDLEAELENSIPTAAAVVTTAVPRPTVAEVIATEAPVVPTLAPLKELPVSQVQPTVAYSPEPIREQQPEESSKQEQLALIEPIATLAARNSIGELYFRASGALSATDRIELNNLMQARWVFTIDRVQSGYSQKQLQTMRLVLTRAGGTKPAWAQSGSILSLGTSATPEARIGGSLADAKSLPAGDYEAAILLGEKTLNTSHITLY